MLKTQWAGRTEGNIWVVIDKGIKGVGDIVSVEITDARGVTMFGKINHLEYKYEVA